jgi:hypothetical protein
LPEANLSFHSMPEPPRPGLANCAAFIAIGAHVEFPREQSRRQEEGVLSGLRHELQALRTADPGMSLLTAVEFVTSDPSHRLALYRRCTEDGDIQARGLSRDDPRLLKIASSSALDLAFLERRARSDGFQVQG